MTSSTKLDLDCYAGFLLDVDGVIVRDKDPIPGSITAVAKLQALGKVIFFSNNSALSRTAYAKKLQNLGITADAKDILSSGTLVARFLSQNTADAKVFLIGELGLRDEIELAGHTLVEGDDADWLVTGQYRQFNYDTLDQGLQVLLNGARWVSSGADGTYPTPDGLKPGAGSIVGAFRGMGFEPAAIVGKPSAYALEQALQDLRISDPKRVLVIGDRLDTDIQGAHNMALDSLLVLTGVTSSQTAHRSELRPTFVAKNLQSVFE